MNRRKKPARVALGDLLLPPSPPAEKATAVIDLGVLHQKRKRISRTYMHHNYTAEKKDAVERLATLKSIVE